MKVYGDAMEIPRPIMDKMLGTSSGELEMVSTTETPDLGRSPSFGEWADTKCGRITQAENEAIRSLTERQARGYQLYPVEIQALEQLQDKQSQHALCQTGLRMRAVDALPAP
jgi:hypothetical protein